MWGKQHWTKEYFDLIEKGSIDKNNVTDWEYNFANLSFPDGMHPNRVIYGGRRTYKP